MINNEQAIAIKQQLYSTQKSILKISGSSMEPLLIDGDHVVIISNVVPVNIGAIYLIEYYGQLLLHRCVQIEQNCICFKGDNSLRIERIEENNIIGQATDFIRNNKFYRIPTIERDIIELSIAVNEKWQACNLDWEQALRSDSYVSLRKKLEKYVISNKDISAG